MRGGRSGQRWRAARSAALVIGLVGSLLAAPRADAAALEVPSIVQLVDGASADAVAAAARVEPTATFDDALDGFAADLTSTEAGRLRGNPLVRRIVPVRTGRLLTPDPADPSLPTANPAWLGLDVVVGQALQVLQGALHGLGVGQSAQVVPTALRRIGLEASPTAAVDHVDDPLDVTIAFVDTGIAPVTDLELAGGTDCVGTGGWDEDGYQGGRGHGTLVASVAAARDDARGIVGTAPGARVLSAKAVDAEGHGSTTSILCALDWAMDPAQGVDVINISLGWPGTLFGASSAPCGAGGLSPDVIHEAICEAVAAGITVVVAAGNEGVDVSDPQAGSFPAAYPEVITVSGLADFDGRPGGLAPAVGCGAGQRDDHLRTTSSYGPAVDIAAVATCVQAVAADGSVTTSAGTSLAAPAVSGALALLIVASGEAQSPAQLQQRLVDGAEPGPIPGDPDTSPEGILRIAGW